MKTPASSTSPFFRRVKTLTAPAALAASALLLPALTSRAEVIVTANHIESEQAKPVFAFKTVRNALDNDLGISISTSLLDGEQNDNSGSPDVLFDGKGPDEEDQPDQNFFFKDEDNGGRLLVTLGKTIPIKEIDTYSWHPNTRAPQVYKLYASDGSGEGFVAEPKRPRDPATCGWKLIASVDTRKKFGSTGGQYGVSIKDSAAALGSYRYLLFDVSKTSDDDAFGNTFFSEINVINADAAADVSAAAKPGEVVVGQMKHGKAIVVFKMDGKEETREIDLPEIGQGVPISVVRARDIAPVKMVPAVWLGVLCEEVGGDLREALPLTPGTGLIVRGLPADGPASKAGLKEHDVLTRLGDQLLVNPAQLQALVRGKHDGDTVRVDYLRHGQEGAVDVKVATHDAPEGGDKDGLADIALRDLTVSGKPVNAQGKVIVLGETGTLAPGVLNQQGLEELEDTLHKHGLDEEIIKKIKQQLADKMKEPAESKEKDKN